CSIVPQGNFLLEIFIKKFWIILTRSKETAATLLAPIFRNCPIWNDSLKINTTMILTQTEQHEDPDSLMAGSFFAWKPNR
ncbi:MAG: hypothetical protein ONB13_05875, partial [candidate division KSB1 bacterium]|nr:hypothetical protein [candidate division KSB1 bacterium]